MNKENEMEITYLGSIKVKEFMGNIKTKIDNL